MIQPLFDRDAFRDQGGRLSKKTNPFGAMWRLTQDQKFTDIDTLLDQYHQHQADDSDQGSVHARMGMLDQIEHHAYQWFDQNKDMAPSHASHKSMRALLESVQQDHETLIGATDQHNHDLWVPNRGGLQLGERQRLDADWDSIRQGQGDIQIHGAPVEDQHANQAGFRNRMLSSFARLMSRGHGRDLVHDLDTGGQAVNIHPMHPHEQAVRPNNAITVPAGGNAFGQENAQQPLGYQAGTGSGSTMRVDPNLSDSASADLDAEGQKIVAPTFITLGHELIHARHNQQGINLEQVDAGRYQQGGDRAGWKDREEYETIAHGPGVTENQLRQEHQLSARHGHEGGRNWREDWGEWFKRQGRNAKRRGRTAWNVLEAMSS